MSTTTHKYPDPKEGSPLLTDEQIVKIEQSWNGSIDGDKLNAVRPHLEIRDLYELDRKGKQAEIDGLRERLAALTKAMGVAEDELQAIANGVQQHLQRLWGWRRGR